MRIIEPYIVLEDNIDGKEILKKIERIGRVCYKSENNIKEGSAEKFVSNLINRHHESVLEHESISVRVICDRGVSHEIVRHRLASYSQESTRYINYTNDKFGNELTFIKPCWFINNLYVLNKYAKDKTYKNSEELLEGEFDWINAMQSIEDNYFILIKDDEWTPEEARSILPNSIKTELVMTMNLREWRHFFKMRCDKAAHPQMREIAYMILDTFKTNIPIIFDDIE